MPKVTSSLISALGGVNYPRGISVVLRALFAMSAAGAIAMGTAVVASAQPGSTPFVNCSAARDAGYEDIPSSSPYYGPHLDRDSDGIGCES